MPITIFRQRWRNAGAALALALAVFGALAWASPATAKEEDRRALEIRSRATVEAGHVAIFQVRELHAHRPVGDAAVYAFPLSAALTASQALDAFAPDAAASDRLTAETLSRWGGWFIGLTSDRGFVCHVFERPGDYVIVALKHGFQPGATRLRVTRSDIPALSIVGPGSIVAGHAARFNVTNRATSEDVAGAAVYAFPGDAIPSTEALTDGLDATALTRWHGRFLGRTGPDGNLVARFREPGRYVIVAVKHGYHPARTALAVMPRVDVRTDADVRPHTDVAPTLDRRPAPNPRVATADALPTRTR